MHTVVSSLFNLYSFKMHSLLSLDLTLTNFALSSVTLEAGHMVHSDVTGPTDALLPTFLFQQSGGGKHPPKLLNLNGEYFVFINLI